MLQITLNDLGCVAMTPELAEWLTARGENPNLFNRMVWRQGASQWAEGRFLMHAADALPRAGVITVKFIDDQGDMITCDKMYQLPARPINWHDDTNALLEIRLVDERYFWQGNIATGDVNVATTDDRSKYYDASQTTPPTADTWRQLITKLSTALGITPQVTLDGAEVGSPIDFVLDGEPAALTLDRVCAALGLVFFAKPQSGQRYVIAQPDTVTSIGVLSGSGDVMAGGYLYNPSTATGKAWLNTIVPVTINVLFPRENPATNTDNKTNTNAPPLTHYKLLTSTAGKPDGVTGRVGMTARVYDTTWAIGPIGTETNLAALQARADYLAARYYNRYRTPQVDALLRGWRDVSMLPGTCEWLHTMAGPFTKVRNDDGWFGYGGDCNVGPGFVDSRVTATGGAQVYKSFDGALFVSATGTGSTTATIKIKSAATGNGEYVGILGVSSGTAFNPATDLDISAHFTFTDDAAHKVMLVNAKEDKVSTNLLAVGQIVTGCLLIGVSVETTPVPTYVAGLLKNEVCRCILDSAGGGGGLTAPVNQTYGVSTLAGTVIGTYVAVDAYGSVPRATGTDASAAAVTGSFYINNSNAVALAWADEQNLMTDCPPASGGTLEYSF